LELLTTIFILHILFYPSYLNLYYAESIHLFMMIIPHFISYLLILIITYISHYLYYHNHTPIYLNPHLFIISLKIISYSILYPIYYPIYIIFILTIN